MQNKTLGNTRAMSFGVVLLVLSMFSSGCDEVSATLSWVGTQVTAAIKTVYNGITSTASASVGANGPAVGVTVQDKSTTVAVTKNLTTGQVGVTLTTTWQAAVEFVSNVVSTVVNFVSGG